MRGLSCFIFVYCFCKIACLPNVTLRASNDSRCNETSTITFLAHLVTTRYPWLINCTMFTPSSIIDPEIYSNLTEKEKTPMLNETFASQLVPTSEVSLTKNLLIVPEDIEIIETSSVLNKAANETSLEFNQFVPVSEVSLTKNFYPKS